MAPDDASERQQRALRVIDEWYRRREQYNNSVASADLSDVDRTRLHDQTGHLQERRCQARRLWTRTDTLGADERLNLTRVITWAGADTFTDSAQRSDVQLLWNLMSGDAHALGWSLTLRGRDWTKDRDGLGVAAAPGDLLDIAQPYVASFRLAKRGVEPIRSACGRERLNRERCRWPIPEREQSFRAPELSTFAGKREYLVDLEVKGQRPA